MLSTTADYALRIMVALSESDGAPMTSERIASITRVPTDYSIKVLQMLARAGFVRAQRGRGGGFRVDCDPGATTLLDIVSAIDPIDRVAGCPVGDAPQHHALCPLHRAIDDAVRLVREHLGQVTLRRLIDSSPGSALCRNEPAVPAVRSVG